MKELFLFELDGELYAVNVEKVDRVMRIPPVTPIPNAPRAIVGIFHLQGKVVVAMDLIRRMEMEKVKPLTATYLFVVKHAKDLFAILIDKPKKMLRVSMSEIQAPDAIIAAHIPAQYIHGVFMHKESAPREEKAPSILITGEEGIVPIEDHRDFPSRPVLWLDLERILSQEDLMRIIASQE